MFILMLQPILRLRNQRHDLSIPNGSFSPECDNAVVNVSVCFIIGVRIYSIAVLHKDSSFLTHVPHLPCC